MRKGCILMHISSLPSAYGIGKLGQSAYAFIDFLYRSGIKCWQILPLSPTSYGDSPYQSFSVNAGNPYFIDFETLEEEGLLERDEYDSIIWEDDSRHVNYNLIYKNKNKEKETVAMRYIEERCFDMKENKRTISVD